MHPNAYILTVILVISDKKGKNEAKITIELHHTLHKCDDPEWNAAPRKDR